MSQLSFVNLIDTVITLKLTSSRRLLHSWGKKFLPAVLAIITILYICHPQALSRTPPPSQPNNSIAIENKKTGTTDWQLTNPATDHEIEGYASLTSVNRGSDIELFVKSKESSYTIDIFRMGWYGGAGGRQIVPAITRTSVQQPPAMMNEDTRLIECDWQDPYLLSIPNRQDEWTSGVYLAKLTTTKNHKQSYIIFVVRDDSRPSDILFQTSVNTYQAYNNWGGASLYGLSKGTQAYKVSFNRPYGIGSNRGDAYGVGSGEFLTGKAGWEYNMLRWLEKEGYDVAYSTDVDTHLNRRDESSGQRVLSLHKAFLVVGHDEYWSWEMRQNVELARDRGISLGFFSANSCYWQIRYEPSRVTGKINRTIVGYKERASIDPFALDDNPENDHLVTTTWRSDPVNRPEDALIGVMYETYKVNSDIIISDTAPKWLLASAQGGTKSHKPRKQKTLVSGIRLPGLLGYEVDRMFGNAPANTIRLAHTPYRSGGQRRYGDMTIYTTDQGATVFATGSMQWNWGLDNYNAPEFRPAVMNQDAQTITRNVLSRMLG